MKKLIPPLDCNETSVFHRGLHKSHSCSTLCLLKPSVSVGHDFMVRGQGYQSEATQISISVIVIHTHCFDDSVSLSWLLLELYNKQFQPSNLIGRQDI